MTQHAEGGRSVIKRLDRQIGRTLFVAGEDAHVPCGCSLTNETLSLWTFISNTDIPPLAIAETGDVGVLARDAA